MTLETISFWQNLYISVFRFSPFSLIKSYQFLKFTNVFNEESEKKEGVKQSELPWRKEKQRNAGLCFVTGCLLKPFKMIIIFSLFLKLIDSVIFTF